MNKTIIHCPTQDLYDRIVEKFGWSSIWTEKDRAELWCDLREKTSLVVDDEDDDTPKIKYYNTVGYWKDHDDYKDYTFTTAEEVLRVTPFERGKTIKELGIDITRKFVVVEGYSVFYSKGDILVLDRDDDSSSPWFKNISNNDKVLACSLHFLVYYNDQSIPELLETWDNVMVRQGEAYIVFTKIDGKYKNRLFDKTEKGAKESTISFSEWCTHDLENYRSFKIIYPFNNEPTTATDFSQSDRWCYEALQNGFQTNTGILSQKWGTIIKEINKTKPMLKQLSNTLKRVLSKELSDQYRAGLINDSMELSDAGKEIMADALSQLPQVQEALNVEAKRIIKEDK